MQIAPAAEAIGTSSRLAPVPTENRKRSTSPAESASRRRLLDEDLVVAERQARAGRPRRGEGAHVVAALGEQLERDRADRARGADDTDARCGHGGSVETAAKVTDDRPKPVPAAPGRRSSRLEVLRGLLAGELRSPRARGPVFLRMGLSPLVEPGDAAGDARCRAARTAPSRARHGRGRCRPRTGSPRRAAAVRASRPAPCRSPRPISSATRTSVLPCPYARLIVSLRTLPSVSAVDPPDDPLDAVVDVGEVEHLVVAAEDGDRLAAQDPVGEQRDHPDHPAEVVVVAARRRSRSGRRCTAAGSSARTSRRAPRRRSSTRSTCSRRRRSRPFPPRSGTGGRRRTPRGSS